MEKITIEISDKAYKELEEKAEKLHTLCVSKRKEEGKEFTMSAYDIIIASTELGLINHIKTSMEIIENNIKKR